jgi:hypothetical protein
MVSKTPSKSLNTWLSQNRSTLYPSARSHSSRVLSSGPRPCCPPSSSMITFFSKFTKSTTYLPTGCCRRNLNPSICLSLRCLHKCRSVSVESFLSFLAMPVRAFTPTRFPPPSRGRVFFWFFIALTLRRSRFPPIWPSHGSFGCRSSAGHPGNSYPGVPSR